MKIKVLLVALLVVAFTAAMTFSTGVLGQTSLNHIRINQVGYLCDEPKIGLIQTNDDLTSYAFDVIDVATGEVVYSALVGEDRGTYGAFAHNFVIDFSAVTTPGTYKISIANGVADYPFKIRNNAYAGIPEMLYEFLRMQRCGPYDAVVHGPCHLHSSIIDDDPTTWSGDAIVANGPLHGQIFNCEGGWHDATASYIKFMETTTYTVDILLFTYEYWGIDKFSEDEDVNGVPDILDEAKVGLEWMLKMHPAPEHYFYQVADKRDYDIWRIPENDTTTPIYGYEQRPVYWGIGSNQAGRYAAAMALAARLYETHDPAFADACLTAGKEVYQLGLRARPLLTTYPHHFYPEKSWEDDMELGAIELYITTENTDYLDDAIDFARRTDYPNGTGFDIYTVNALAHYVLYPYVDPPTQEFLKSEMKVILTDAMDEALTNPYRIGEPYEWGTNNLLMGTAFVAILWENLFGDPTFMDLARQQRDYVLGRNQWGVSYIIGKGTDYPDDPHSAIADLTGAVLTGCFIEGPAPYTTWFSAYWAKLSEPDEYAEFQSVAAVYHDDVNDYVTNEGAIDYQCSVLFVMAYYAP